VNSAWASGGPIRQIALVRRAADAASRNIDAVFESLPAAALAGLHAGEPDVLRMSDEPWWNVTG
jgi:hypothetical protein